MQSLHEQSSNKRFKCTCDGKLMKLSHPRFLVTGHSFAGIYLTCDGSILRSPNIDIKYD